MERFAHYFGHSTKEEADQMVAAAIWEDKDKGTTTDVEAVEKIIRRIATNELSYEGLSEQEAQILDQHIKVLFGPWGFEEQLDIEHESPEEYHHFIELEERLPKDIEFRFMPVLRFGWRYGTTDVETEPGYFILPPEQVEALAREINGAMANPVAWSDPFFGEMIDRTLVQVVNSVIGKKKGLAGTLG
jgi:hypothetical protein